jgi:nucleoside-diphosphate-sugar epimerase
VPLRGSVALVTGGAGAVGAALVRRLLGDGVVVHAILRPETDRWRIDDLGDRLVPHEADLTDTVAVRRIVGDVDPDVMFHLARHRGNPAALDYREAYAHNVEATLNLLEAAEVHRVKRFVHVGSSLEYDLDRSPLRESDAPAPRTAHGVTKAAATLLAQHFARERGLPVVVLRVFTVYGPWEAPKRFVPQLMLAALENRPLSVTSDRNLAHDWILVDDVVEACVRAATVDGVAGEVVNVGTGCQSTNEQLIGVVEKLVGRSIVRAEAPFPKRTWDTAHWVADVTKARERLGWHAEADIHAGLGRTLEWFRSQPQAVRERYI